MKSLIARLLLLAAAPCVSFWLGAAHGQALAPAANLSWDCWISSGKVVSIRCIAAREGLEPADPALDSNETLLLDQIHSLIHNGRSAEIDGLVRANIDVFRQGSIRSIRLWDYPTEASWMEDRPARIVRAALCPKGATCQVFVSRH